MVSNILQSIGLVLDIAGFAILVWEVGYSHRIQILSDKPPQQPDFAQLDNDADAFRRKYLKKIYALKEIGGSDRPVKFLEPFIRWKIKSKYNSVERKRQSFEDLSRMAALPKSESMLQRRFMLMGGAALVFTGFFLQLIGVLIALFSA